MNILITSSFIFRLAHNFCFPNLIVVQKITFYKFTINAPARAMENSIKTYFNGRVVRLTCIDKMFNSLENYKINLIIVKRVGFNLHRKFVFYKIFISMVLFVRWDKYKQI